MTAFRAPDPMRNVTRRDWPGQYHGWEVDFRPDGLRIVKKFADSKHGGRRGALAAAQAWRDATEAELAAARAPRRCPDGVLCRRDRHYYVVGCWTDPATGAPRRKYVRIGPGARLPLDEAVRRAVEAKVRGENRGELPDHLYTPLLRHALAYARRYARLRKLVP